MPQGSCQPRPRPSPLRPTCRHAGKPVALFATMLGTLLAIGNLAGCGTPAARDFGGPWKPVNRYQAAPAAIPLQPAYTFFATPMDGTLRNMLARWAADAGMTLAYRLPFDYTLYTPVSGIRTTDVRVAAAQLDRIYAPAHVHVAIDDGRIVVEQAAGAVPDRTVRAHEPTASTGLGVAPPAAETD